MPPTRTQAVSAPTGGVNPAGAKHVCAHGREACVARSLLTAANLLTRVADKASASIGLTSSRWMMLCAVGRSQEAPSVGSLSQDAMLSAQNVSRMLTGMEEDGLVRRFHRPGHGRAVFVELTPQGVAALEGTRELAERLDADFLRAMPPERVQRLERDLAQLIENLSDMEKDSAACEA